MSDEPGFAGSNNPKLSALRVLDEPQFIRIVGTAITNNSGVLLKTAKALHVHRNTLNRWIEQYPALALNVIQARGEAP